jgi:hypothetical protein
MKKACLVSLILLAGLLGVVSCGQAPEQQAAAKPTAEMNSTFPNLPLAPSIPPPPGEVILQDNFEQPSDAWTVLDAAEVPGEEAHWRVEGGVLAQRGLTSGFDSVDAAYLVTGGGVEWSDYIVRANLYVETNDEVGLIFRVNEEGFYRFRMRSEEFDGPYSVGLDRYEGGMYTALWHEPGNGFPLRKWFTLQIEVAGDTFTISVNGQELTVVRDPVFSAGGVGVYAWAEGGAYFDDVVVTR